MLLVPALFLAKHGSAVRRTDVRARASAAIAPSAEGSREGAPRAPRSESRFEDAAAVTTAAPAAPNTQLLPIQDPGGIGNATLTALQVQAAPAPTTTTPPTTAKPVTT